MGGWHRWAHGDLGDMIMKKLSWGYIYFGFCDICLCSLQSLLPIISIAHCCSVAMTPWILPPLTSLTNPGLCQQEIELDHTEVTSTDYMGSGEKHGLTNRDPDWDLVCQTFLQILHLICKTQFYEHNTNSKSFWRQWPGVMTCKET